MHDTPRHLSASGRKAVQRAADSVRRHWRKTPRVAIVLGTGLGQFAENVESEASLGYGQVPGFASTTALSHRGRLICGQLADVPLIMFDGRCHLYEGYSYEQVTRPVLLARALGAQFLIVSNAGGGLNPQFCSGDVMIITDHINLMGRQGQCPPELLPRAQSPAGRPARSADSPYDTQLALAAQHIARSGAFPAQQGVYIGVAGPNYETVAEYRFLRQIGGDVVGMSTVPEVTVAAGLGMRILGLSIVTNVAKPDARQTVLATDVVDVAASAAPHLQLLVEKILADAL